MLDALGITSRHNIVIRTRLTYVPGYGNVTVGLLSAPLVLVSVFFIFSMKSYTDSINLNTLNRNTTLS